MPEETPILDLRQAPPVPRSTTRGRVIGLVIGVVVGLALAYRTPDGPPSLTGLLWLPALYLVITIHELGHLIAGRLVGMKPGGIVIGGFSVMRSGRGYSWRFNWRQIAGGGMALSLTTKDQFTARQFAWMVAGGPLGSLLLTLACGIIRVINPDYANGFINTVFWIGLLSLTSLIPASSGINKSDGGKLLELIRSPQQAWIALVALQSEDRTGVRPRDWDPELVAQVHKTDPEAKEYPYSELLLFHRAYDLGNEAASLTHLEHALSASKHAGKLLRQGLYLEAASASALIRREAEKAEVWLKRAEELGKVFPAHGARAAIAICEGKDAEALKHIAAQRDFFRRRRSDSGTTRMALEVLSGQESLCEAARARST